MTVVVIRDSSAHDAVVIRDSGAVAVAVRQQQVVRVLTGTAQGPAGPAGPIGPAGATYMTLIAGTPLSGHKVVKISPLGSAHYADSDNPADAGSVVGVTMNAALPGDPVNVQAAGELGEVSWSWTPGLPVFLGPAGTLTQVPAATGFQLAIGVAVTPTKLIINIKQPIVL